MRKLLLIPILLSGASLASAAPTTGAAGVAKPTIERINAGELRIDGKVTALLGEGVWQVDAVAWTSPRGVTTNFDEVKVKSVQVNPDALVHLRGSSTKVALKDIKLKSTVAIIGKNGPDGTLIGREVILLDDGDNERRTVGTLSTNAETSKLIDQSRKARDLGQLPKSLELAKRAAETAAGLGDFSGEALATQDVALVLTQLARYPEAMSAFQHEQALGERINNPLAQVLGLQGQSGLLAASGKTDEAIEALERASGLTAGTPAALRTGVLSRLGSVYRQAGKRNESVGAYVRLLQLQSGDDALSTQLTLALLQAPADAASAQEYLDQARQQIGNIRDEKRKPGILVQFADALKATGNAGAASEQYEAAAKLLEDNGDAEGAARIRERAAKGTVPADDAPATPNPGNGAANEGGDTPPPAAPF